MSVNYHGTIALTTTARPGARTGDDDYARHVALELRHQSNYWLHGVLEYSAGASRTSIQIGFRIFSLATSPPGRLSDSV